MSGVSAALDAAIQSLGLYANFDANITQGPPELIVQFTSTSSGNPDTWEWDFNNDGTIDSYEENPEWGFTTVGSYDVSLTVYEGADSDELLQEDFITVIDPSNVSGQAAGTWSPTYGTYTITGDVTVPVGTVLSIEPSTNIVVNNNSKIQINGRIEAQGSERGLINFSTDDQWKGIKIVDSQEDNLIAHCYFTGSTESAVDIDNSSVDVLNSTFYENTNTSQKGPAINVLDASDVLIEGNIISNNNSSVTTGGIALDNAAVEISHNIIVNNQAIFAGAIVMKNGSNATLINNTIANNEANYACIYLLASYPNVLNTIIIHDGLIFTTFSSDPIVSYSCISGGYSGTGNISDDPQFVNPTAGDGNAYNGLIADWSLQATSPCIDTGDPSSPPDPDGTIADMGALYYHQQISVDDPHSNMIYVRQNTPNPFSGSTAISYSLPKNSNNDVITIYNVKGDVVKEFVLEDTEGEIVWNGFDQNNKAVASGVYFYRLQGDSISQTRSMVFMK
ncbi:MAG: hypothetical protein B1H05_00320 [Candidatus Cloacimonas sp. 4484_140]|nr:MAG: hypothetical protein B1H05_00320 [Candidatus Cloacimonas sp. 4484_140]